MFSSKVILFITFLTIISSKEPNKELIPFNVTHLHKLNRISGYVLTKDKSNVIYVNRQWNEEKGKFRTNLKYFTIDWKRTKELWSNNVKAKQNKTKF